MTILEHKPVSLLVRKLLPALPGLLLVLAIAPNVASAHARIATSSPPGGATVAPGLTQIILNFTEEVSLEQSQARLVGPDGSEVPGVASAVDRAVRTRMTVTTPPLQAGKYTIKWTTVTDNDNAHTNGTIDFSVAASSAGSTASANRAPDANGSQPTAGVGSSWLLIAGALAVALLFAAVAVVRARLKRKT